MELLARAEEVEVEEREHFGMNPSACCRCGSHKTTDLGPLEPGIHVYRCQECKSSQDVIMRRGKPVGLSIPGNGPSTMAYRLGEEPVHGMPTTLPCGCKRGSRGSVLLANGSRVCMKHQIRFRLSLRYVKE